MPFAPVKGIELYYETHGTGLVLVSARTAWSRNTGVDFV